MEILLQQIINGLVLGSMYALIALGYTMVYGIINLINFAHGEVLMVGALTSWTIIGLMQESMPGAPGWIILIIALIIACVVAATLNFVIEKVAYRPLRNSPKLAPLITAIGMSILLQTLAMIIWRPTNKAYPTLLPSDSIDVGGAVDLADAGDDPGRHGGLAGRPDVAGQLHQARPRHARHRREPARRGADGHPARHGDLGDLHHRRGAGGHRRRDVRLQLRHRAARDGFLPGTQGLHGGGVRRHRQPGRRGGRRHPARPDRGHRRGLHRRADRRRAGQPAQRHLRLHHADPHAHVRPSGLLGERVADRA